jgi:hypothetical protein
VTGVAFLDAPAGACAFIIGFNPNEPRASVVCGAPRRAGRPYCAEHCAEAYLPTPPLDMDSVMNGRLRVRLQGRW